MRGRRPAAALLVLALWLHGAGAAETSPAPRSMVPWTSFRLEAEKLTGRITADVRLQPEPAMPRPPGLWPSVPGEPLAPDGSTVLALSIGLTIEPVGMAHLRMAPLRLENRLWFDPVSEAPLRLIRTRLRVDDYVQWFVFGREGVFRRQHEPANQRQAKEPPENWTRVSENQYALRDERCPSPVETSMLIVLLSDAVARGALDLGAPVRVPQAPASPPEFPSGATDAGALRLLGANRGRVDAPRGQDRCRDDPDRLHADRIVPGERGALVQGRLSHLQRRRAPAAGGRLRPARGGPCGASIGGNQLGLIACQCGWSHPNPTHAGGVRTG